MTNTHEHVKFTQVSNENYSERQLDKYDQSKKEHDTKPYRVFFSKRLLILILLFCGYIFSSIMKIYINISVIEMTTNKTMFINNQTTVRPPEFNWDTKTVGSVLASFSYGFLFSAIGGYLATRFGGSYTYGVNTALAAVLNILNPISLGLHYYAFYACRILMGLCEGFAYASTAEIFSRWIPVKERSTFMAIIFCGIYMAVAFSYPICGYIAYYWGWRMICYISGGLSLVGSIVWLLLVKNEPSQDTCISKKEVSYITRETADSISKEKITYPYKEILTSAPVWANCAGKFAYGWGFGIIITCLPLYIKDITQKEVNEVGAISSIPNFVCIFMTPVAGAMMDYLQNHTSLKATQIHKMMMSVGFGVSSILFAIVAFSTNLTLSMICFSMIKLLLSFNFLIVQLICLFLAPRYSSIILGMTAFWGVISHIVIPTVVGSLVVHHTLQEWSNCFLLSAGILMFGAIVFMMYGSSDLQPWAMASTGDSRKEMEEKLT